MTAGFCYYDCSNPPTKLSAYPDISGIGVTLAYSLTAGLALLLVVIYYILAYHPSALVFNETAGQIPLAKPNPIDELLLSWRWGTDRHSAQDHDTLAMTRKHRLVNALTQCMLVISDFQLVTGLSILISGFSQLNCGISQYHWQKIVQLAWFSSITHLCCLTFLRDHFSRRRVSAQFWRVPGMVVLIIMLVVALIPTGQYNWTFESTVDVVQLAKPAICSFFPHQIPHLAEDQAGVQRMGLSIGLLLVGMLVRLCRLFEAPASFCLYTRQICSRWSKMLLWKLHSSTQANSALAGAMTLCLYRPLLAIFICGRIMLDLTSSRVFEVWWLGLSYSWGMLNLWHQERDIEPESQQWNFGQVIALVLLIAPLLALTEGYWSNIQGLSDSTNTHGRANSLPGPTLPRAARCTPASSNSISLEKATARHLEHDPEYDYYQCPNLSSLVGVILCTIAIASSWTVKVFTIEKLAPIEAFYTYTPYTLAISLVLCANVALVMDKFVPQSSKKRTIAMILYGLVFAVTFQVSIAAGFLGQLRGVEFWLRVWLIITYVGLSVVQARKKKWRDV